MRGEHDEGLLALARFLERWTPQNFTAPHFSPDMLDSNLVFRLEGERQFLHDRPAAVALRARLLAPDDGGAVITLPCLGNR